MIELHEVEFAEFIKTHSREETANQFQVSKSTVDRWRLKLGLPRKTFQHRDLKHNITDEQLEIISGSLLGDGSLTLVGHYGRKNSKFTETHSMKQLEWLNWKNTALLPLSRPTMFKEVKARKCEHGRIVTDHSKMLSCCVFETITHPCLTDMEAIWYQRDETGEYITRGGRRIKIVPASLSLTPRMVAVWYFDDGSNSPQNRRATLNTQAFSKEDCEMLRNKLGQLGVEFGLSKNKDGYVLVTRAASYLRFIEMVSEYATCDCIRHKVDLASYRSPDYSTRFTKKFRRG